MTDLDQSLALGEIEAHGTVRDLGRIARHLAPYGSEHAFEALRALEGVLSRVSARDLIALGASRVLSSYQLGATAWSMLDPARMATLHPCVLRLATFHASGYVREAALVVLASSSDSDALPYLLLRTNDWVASVAVRARDAVSARLTTQHAEDWVKALPIVHHLRTVTRHALGPLLDQAIALLAAPEARGALRTGLTRETREIRRACIAVVTVLPPEQALPLLTAAMRDRDPGVVSKAAVALLASAAPADLEETIGSLLRNRTGSVRARAFTALWAHFPAHASGRSRDALFDPALLVREIVQYELRRHETIDLPSLYVAALPGSHSQKLLAAIDGLAACGTAAHAPVILPFTGHASPRVRAAAIRALARLDGDAYASTFLAALRSDAPRVAKAGHAGLKRRAHLVDQAELEAIASSEGANARVAFALFAESDYWAALLATLRASTDPALGNLAKQHLAHLLGKQSFSRARQHPALVEAFAHARSELPSDLVIRIEELLVLSKPR